MRLNTAGEMITSTWEANIERYPGSALDAFVVMPNTSTLSSFSALTRSTTNQKLN
ncbi:MAG: hypothetical protein M3457_13345 [Chloroflexota bacterium]|nr:hypothetical protein [Chloroflexota bacterium]